MHTRTSGDQGTSGPVLVVLATIATAVIVAAAWGLSVLLADPVGRGEAIKQRESANNRIFANEQFEKLSAEYDTTLVKIDQAAAVRSTSPEAEVRLQGLASYCASVVADYNAAARSFRTEQFRAVDLPESLDAARCVVPVPAVTR